MSNNKTSLAVAALKQGTVIDHIPSHVLFDAVKILNLQQYDTPVTIGYNLESRKIGSKGIIKVADVEFDEATLGRIAIIAPTAVVNIIRNYEVATKRQVVLPDTIVGIVKCDNPKCITNNEPMDTRFHVVDRNPVLIRCHYCNHVIEGSKAHV